jgi:hypothetical protein
VAYFFRSSVSIEAGRVYFGMAFAGGCLFSLIVARAWPRLVVAAERIHADDTRVPVLAQG